MSLITQAYFQEGDFSNTDIIRQTYQNLNDCLTDDMLHTQQLYVGLSGTAAPPQLILKEFSFFQYISSFVMIAYGTISVFFIILYCLWGWVLSLRMVFVSSRMGFVSVDGFYLWGWVFSLRMFCLWGCFFSEDGLFLRIFLSRRMFYLGIISQETFCVIVCPIVNCMSNWWRS